MVALAQSDQLLASWIYVPVTGTLARSVVGEGAWVDGRKISSRVLEEGERLSGVIAVGQRGGADLVSRAQSLRQTARQIKSSRCAGLDYLRLAQGELDFVLFSGVMPWDHAPGVALLNEIGGQASYASGAAYRPSQASDAKGVLTARNSDIWRRVFDRLYPQGVGATSA
jgi:fructose-1,6-bisphosphatase/inositol monophosphatase family enzyme